MGRGVSSDTGLELGKRLTFHYALVPHSGDWRQAEIFREGIEFNHPAYRESPGIPCRRSPTALGFS